MAAKTLDIMIQNVDIVYSDKVVRGNLGIRDGKIVPATGEAREVIDGTGLTALPGCWTHMYIFALRHQPPGDLLQRHLRRRCGRHHHCV